MGSPPARKGLLDPNVSQDNDIFAKPTIGSEALKNSRLE